VTPAPGTLRFLLTWTAETQQRSRALRAQATEIRIQAQHLRAETRQRDSWPPQP
jgi:hypothetical protein